MVCIISLNIFKESNFRNLFKKYRYLNRPIFEKSDIAIGTDVDCCHLIYL